MTANVVKSENFFIMVSTEIKIFVVSSYLTLVKSLSTKKARFEAMAAIVNEQFGLTLCLSAIRKYVELFSSTSSVIKVYKRRKTINQARDSRIIGLFDREPNISIRKASRKLQFLYSTIRTELRSAGLKPYKIFEVQKLTRISITKRNEFCRWILNSEIDINNIWFSDEKMFGYLLVCASPLVSYSDR